MESSEVHPMWREYLDFKASTQDTETKNQYIATICVSLGAVCVGTVLAWTSPVLPQLQIPAESNVSTTISNISTVINDSRMARSNISEAINSTLMNNSTDATNTSGFQLTQLEGSLVGSMLAMGALFSALPAGYVADKYGRKNANLFLTVPFMINWILIVFSTGPFMLYVARFFAGIATGAICVTAPMYIGEIAEVSVRKFLESFFTMCLCFGIFLTYLTGALVSWIALSWILMIVPLMFASCFYFMPETPTYLAKTGHISAAKNSLKFFRGKTYSPDYELKIIQADLAKANEKSASVKDLFNSKGNKKALISTLGLIFIQQFSGINAVIFYTIPIFESAGSGLQPAIAAIIVSIIQFIIAYVGAMTSDIANRRSHLMLSSLGMMICLGALGLYFHLQANAISFTGIGILPLGSMVLFIVMFYLGFGPVPWVIMDELFAPEIKRVVSDLAVTCNWILVFIVTFSFPIMNSSLGGHVTFYFFGIVMAVGTFFVYIYVPETQGKILRDIQILLNK